MVRKMKMGKALFQGKALFLAFLLFGASFAVALDANAGNSPSGGLSTDVSAILEQLQPEIQGQKITGPFARFFSHDRINVYIKDDTGDASKDKVVGIQIENRVISGFGEEVQNPSLKLYVDSATITSLAGAENPLPAVKKAWEDKKITYEAVGVRNKFKFAMASVLLKVFLSKSEDVGKADNSMLVGKAVQELPSENDDSTDDSTTPEVEVEEVETEVADTAEEIEAEETAPPAVDTAPRVKSHTVNLIEGGFEESVVTIKVGEKVVWQNVREGRVTKALVLGAQKCSRIKSSFFGPGEFFSWTFEQPGTCLIVDGIYTTQTMKVVVK